MMNRRQFLKLLSAGSFSGLSGCSSFSLRESNTLSPVSSPSPIETPTSTPTAAATRTQAEEWEVNPVEHDKLIGTYYYPWYKEEDDWTLTTPGTPILGNYDSQNRDVINQHIKWAVEHGINWFATSWRGKGNFRDETIRNHLFEAELSGEINISINIPSHGLFLPEEDTSYLDFDNEINHRILRDNLLYLENEYFNHPNYLRIDDRPVVWFYLAKFFVGDVKTAFQKAEDELETDPYIIGDLFTDRTRRPGSQPILRDWANEFDAATIYNIYGKCYGIYSSEEVDGYDEFVALAEDTLFEWKLQAENADLDFIPNLVPGFNNSEWWHPPGRILERSPDGFRGFSRAVLDRMDSERDAVMVTSFNEWPEYTAVEPAEEYGTTYLEIIEQELAGGEPEYVNPEPYYELRFKFNKTIKPGTLYGSNDSRDVAICTNTLTIKDGSGGIVANYDIGYPLEEPLFADGVYLPQEEDAEGIGWVRDFGGPRSQAIMYLNPDIGSVSSATIQAFPIVSNEIEADVYFEDNKTDQILFGDRTDGWHEYQMSLN